MERERVDRRDPTGTCRNLYHYIFQETCEARVTPPVRIISGNGYPNDDKYSAMMNFHCNYHPTSIIQSIIHCIFVKIGTIMEEGTETCCDAFSAEKFSSCMSSPQSRFSNAYNSFSKPVLGIYISPCAPIKCSALNRTPV